MKIEIVDKKLAQIKAEIEVIFVINKNLKHRFVEDHKLLANLGFRGEAEQNALLPEKKRLYIGLDSLSPAEIREGAALAVKILAASEFKSIKIASYFEAEAEKSIQAMAEGFILGAYKHTKYKSKNKPAKLKEIFIAAENYSEQKSSFAGLSEALQKGRIMGEAVNFVRDIVNQTPEEITPQSLARLAKDLAKEKKIKAQVFGDAYLKKAGMGAMLAVSKGSPHPAQLIHLTYKPAKAKLKIALVGKGLTYDTGGLSLKPSDSMRTMKADKAGGAAVLGIMKAAAELKLPFEIHGIVGAVENAIGQHAYKPDDVLKAKNGKTIEVQNTDAEGRLVLADCLCYAQESQPDYIIDLATLTGACMVALGEHTIGVMGHSHSLKEAFHSAGQKAGEFTGNLPFNKYLKKMLKSEVADISNISASRYGGAITAALFLSEFIEEKNRHNWVHLDIAGPAFTEKPWGPYGYGATGAGIRLVIEWLKAF